MILPWERRCSCLTHGAVRAELVATSILGPLVGALSPRNVLQSVRPPAIRQSTKSFHEQKAELIHQEKAGLIRAADSPTLSLPHTFAFPPPKHVPRNEVIQLERLQALQSPPIKHHPLSSAPHSTPLRMPRRGPRKRRFGPTHDGGPAPASGGRLGLARRRQLQIE